MPASDDSTQHAGPLHGPDAAALDALVEAGFDPDRVDPVFRERATRVAALLGLLDPVSLPSLDGELADGVLAAVRATAETGVRLSGRDDAALEAMVMAGFDQGRVAGPLRDRAGAHEALLHAVTTLGPEGETWVAQSRASRSASVLAAVAQAEAAPIPIESFRGPRGFRLGDLLVAAAVLLIFSAIGMPVMNSMTEEGRRVVCQSNLHAAGLGLGLYAMAHDDALPMATAGFGGSWSQVGNPGRSHSANLFTLVRTRHVPSWSLTCPGNDKAPEVSPDRDASDWKSLDEVSYSYRLMPQGEARLHRLSPDSVVLADRSPILIAGHRGQRVSPEANSPNHGREGQHLLRVDDSVAWVGSPVLENGDNIWLPREIEELVQKIRDLSGHVRGSELPASVSDTFLGP